MKFMRVDAGRARLEETVETLPGKFYLSNVEEGQSLQQLYHCPRGGGVENEEERRLDVVDWREFKKKCTKLSAEEVVDILADPEQVRKANFIYTKYPFLRNIVE